MPTFTTPAPISATIEVGIGDVRISTGDGGATVVEVAASDASNRQDVRAAEMTRVEYANEQLLVRAPKLRSWLNWSGGGSIQVTIELPAGSHLDAAAGAADFHSDGRLGECRIKTGLGHVHLDQADSLSLRSGSGDISVDRVIGRADVTAASGDVRLGELGSSAVIKNSNGDTWVGVANGDLRLKAANGSTSVDVAHGDVDVKAANGDVRVGQVVRGSIVLETHIGDVEVGIRQGTTAWLDVKATTGRVRNVLDASDAPDPSGDNVEVRARTSVGDVAIRRS